MDGGLGELAALGIKAYVLPGTTYHEVVLELPLQDGTPGIALSTTELLGNLSELSDLAGLSRLMRLLLRLLGPPGGGLGVARVVRWREVSDRKRVAAWLRSMAALRDIRLVLVGHGAPVTDDAAASLRRAAGHL